MSAANRVLVPYSHNSEALGIGIHHAIETSKTARRQRSLRRGAAAWAAEVRYRGGATRGAVLLTLTFAVGASDLEAAASIRRFWDKYSKRYGRVQRLSWLEYQGNGRHHYHAIVIDPPKRAQGHDWRKIAAMWGMGRTNLLWRNREWVDNQALRYAVSYAKKFGEKGYQQQYEQASSAIRTFHTNRLRSADARLERLPRWAHHAAREAGLVLVDGKRRVGGGIECSVSREGPSGTQASRDAVLTIPASIHWGSRSWWPPGTTVVTLGAPSWLFA